MNKAIHQMVASMYKDESGRPIDLSPAQVDIFEAIATRGASIGGKEFEKRRPRWQSKTFTRFGKSFSAGLAILTRAATYPEKWAVVSGNTDQAKQIMGYINTHIFDNEFTAGRFRMETGDSAEAIRRNRNKNHISFDVGGGQLGEVFITTAKGAIGKGAKNIVEDEASLIPDDEHALVMRMLGDDPHDNFLFKIGNPFLRNHFLKSDLDPAYEKLTIDCYRGLKEGRITQEVIDENSVYRYFPVLYECKFPSAEDVDDKGWSYLFTEADIERATKRNEEDFGRRRLGVDVARGGRDYNVWVLRGDNFAKVLKKDHDNDLMSVAGKTKTFIEELRLNPADVFIDDTGVGGGVVDRLIEQGLKITPVTLGGKAYSDEEEARHKEIEEEAKRKGITPPYVEMFLNKRARLYAGKDGLEPWLRRTGKLYPDKDWVELTVIRSKKDSTGKTKIEPKEDLRARGEHSPDVADALMLTFEKNEIPKGEGTFHAPNPADILGQGRKHSYL